MVHKVDTGASILAWLVLALIHFILAVDTLISWDTLPRASKRNRKYWPIVGHRPWEQMRSVKLPVTLFPRPLYASLASSHSLLTTLCRVSSHLTGIYHFQPKVTKSHLKGKARTEYSERYFRWSLCRTFVPPVCRLPLKYAFLCMWWGPCDSLKWYVWMVVKISHVWISRFRKLHV